MIDFRPAVFSDSVVDNDGPGGDATTKAFNVNSEDGTSGFVTPDNAYLFAGEDP